LNVRIVRAYCSKLRIRNLIPPRGQRNFAGSRICCVLAARENGIFRSTTALLNPSTKKQEKEGEVRKEQDSMCPTVSGDSLIMVRSVAHRFSSPLTLALVTVFLSIHEVSMPQALSCAMMRSFWAADGPEGTLSSEDTPKKRCGAHPSRPALHDWSGLVVLGRSTTTYVSCSSAARQQTAIKNDTRVIFQFISFSLWPVGWRNVGQWDSARLICQAHCGWIDRHYHISNP
jgi:hypothetical protein